MSDNLEETSLSRRLVILIILFSSLITLMLTGIQLLLEYKREAHVIEVRLDHIKSSYKHGIENAIWDLDKKQVQVQIDGIRRLPDIGYVEVNSDEGFLLSSGSKTESERTLRRDYKLSHVHKDSEYSLGNLTVIATLEATFNRLLNRIGITLLSNALKTFLVVIFITLLLKRTVIRHLQDVSEFIRQMSLGDYEHSFRLNRKTASASKVDDLDNLAGAVNKLRLNSKKAFLETHLAKEMLQKNVVHLQQLDAVSTALETEYDPDLRIKNTLESILHLFGSDRALLAYIDDTESSHFQIPICVTHPKHPLMMPTSKPLVTLPEIANVLKQASASLAPIVVEYPNPLLELKQIKEINVLSSMLIALKPKFGGVWLLVLHQCRYARKWADDEKKLFAEISARLTDPLGNYLYHKRLIRSQERLEEAQSITHIGNWESDLFSHKVTWSDEVFRIMGYPPQSFEPNDKIFQELLHEQDRERVISSIKEALVQTSSGEFRIVRPDNTQRILWGTARVSKDHNGTAVRIFGVIQDITERKEKELALQESEQRLIEAQKIAQVGHWEYEIKSDVSYWSTEFYNILGYAPNSFTPSKNDFYHLIHPDDRPSVLFPKWNDLNQPTQQEYRIIRPDGSERHILGEIRNSVKESSGEKRIFSTIQDITERKQLEQKNRQQELQLIQADKMSSLGLMVSGVAHEINNPNNLIQINASMLEEMLQDVKPILDKYQSENNDYLIGGISYTDAINAMPEMVSSMADASRRIERIIHDLKNFSRSGNDKELSKVSVNEAVNASIRLLKPLILSKTDHLILDLAEDLSFINGNLQHLEQIVINLISNALDALPSKQHKIWITTTQNTSNDEIVISIKDNGVGIPDPEINKIFDPFYTTKIESGGTGLGLAIAFSLVTQYKGYLFCSSKVNVGTTFTVSFPIAHDD